MEFGNFAEACHDIKTAKRFRI